jgi:hypothetical protein
MPHYYIKQAIASRGDAVLLPTIVLVDFIFYKYLLDESFNKIVVY